MRSTDPPATRPLTLVWIDAREAFVVRETDTGPEVLRLESEVPPHRRETGHVRYNPATRHGGGKPQTAGEPHRLEHLRRFVDEVAERVPPGDDVRILGPGTVHERLERRLHEYDAHHGRRREIAGAPSMRLTERQLIARRREAAGSGVRRRTVGAYRWSTPTIVRLASGEAVAAPRRVGPKPPPRPFRGEV